MTMPSAGVGAEAGDLPAAASEVLPYGAPEPPPEPPPLRTPAVAVVGAGPSGLRAAAGLAAVLGGDVLVLDRGEEPGGVPRLCLHLGFGIRDLHRFYSGAVYAEILASRAAKAGAQLVTRATVSGMSPDGVLRVASPTGPFDVAARATILATGARERQSAAWWAPGGRPVGVYTTEELLETVQVQHLRVGARAVIVGADMAGWAAACALKQAGCRTVLMTTAYPAPGVSRLISAPGKRWLGTLVSTCTRLTRVLGDGRVRAVEVQDVRHGIKGIVECDTVVFASDWIPERGLAQGAGVALDPHTLGPAVDAGLRTDHDGIFAIGDVAHPVDTADGASLDGAHVAPQVIQYLQGHGAGVGTVPIVPGRWLAWVSPSRFAPHGVAPSRGLVSAWPTRLFRRPQITAVQNGHEIGHATSRCPAAPGRVFRIPFSVVRAADREGGPVTIEVD